MPKQCVVLKDSSDLSAQSRKLRPPAHLPATVSILKEFTPDDHPPALERLQTGGDATKGTLA
jgi:hypothetical protein